MIIKKEKILPLTQLCLGELKMDRTVCKCRRAKLTRRENTPVYSIMYYAGIITQSMQVKYYMFETNTDRGAFPTSEHHSYWWKSITLRSRIVAHKR